MLGVFGLSIRTIERDLDEEFSRFGRVVKVTIVYDQRVGEILYDVLFWSLILSSPIVLVVSVSLKCPLLTRRLVAFRNSMALYVFCFVSSSVH